jgi:hypothetical protein
VIGQLVIVAGNLRQLRRVLEGHEHLAAFEISKAGFG